jgi:selenide, water dikinase
VRRLLLLGGGHAHAQVLLALRKFVSRNLEVSLVSAGARHTYSGMVPGVIAGHYSEAQAQIDLAALCRKSATRLYASSATGIDARRKCVTLTDGRELAYDLLSINVGASPNWSRVPGAAPHAVGVKPFEPFIAAWRRLPRGATVAVVGGGAAGVELAMAMKHAGAGAVTLFSEKNEFRPDIAGRLRRALARMAVDVRANTPVTEVVAGPGIIFQGGKLEFDAVFWAAGASALPWLAESGLACNEAGYIRIDDALRSISHPEVFAAGDTAALEGHDLPKSGVYAVRQGAVLAENLKRAAVGSEPRRYVPQEKTLYLISCGDKYAIASRGNWSAEGAWAWHWKDWIDRRWMRRFS